MLSVHNLYKTYPGPTHALANVTFELKPGELNYLIGHSGAGKTTLFNIINGFEQPSSGTVKIRGENLSQISYQRSRSIRQDIGVIFQDFRLLNHKSLFDNIMIPLIIRNVTKNQAITRLYEITDELGLTPILQKMPTQVSGGEKQRVAIARALISDPAFVFADEPTGSLDPDNGKNIFRTLSKLAQNGKTVLVATHNLELLNEFPGRILRLSQGQLEC